MKLYLTHSLESRCKIEKKMVESLSMFVFFRDQKDFYGVTLNGCSGEGSDMVNLEHSQTITPFHKRVRRGCCIET